MVGWVHLASVLSDAPPRARAGAAAEPAARGGGLFARMGPKGEGRTDGRTDGRTWERGGVALLESGSE